MELSWWGKGRDLVVGGVHNNEREEPIREGLVEHLKETAPVARLHGFIILILLNLLLYPVSRG